MPRDIDLGYEIMTILAANPDLNLSYPLNIFEKPIQYPPLVGLYDRLGGETLLYHFYLMENEGFIGRLPGPRRYVLTTEGHDFLAKVKDKGGWGIVKEAAVNQPVRLTMRNIWEWLDRDFEPGHLLSGVRK